MTLLAAVRALPFTIAASALCALPAMPAQAGEDVQVVRPISAWAVDWRPEYCVVNAMFGSQEQPLYFQMSQYGPGHLYEFALTGKVLRPFVSAEQVAFSFGKHGKARPAAIQRADSELYGEGMIFSAVLGAPSADESRVQPFADDELATDIDRIVVQRGSHRLIVGTGPLAGIVSAMRKCADDLVTTWGLDPKAQATLSRPATAVDIRGLVRTLKASYPRSLSYKGKQARLNVHARIDASGAVTHCSVPESYNDPKFDELACRNLRGYAFEPALDAQGNPVASYWNTTIIYTLRP